MKIKTTVLKYAILNFFVINFYYYSNNGRKSIREVEPIKLVFENKNWYLFSYCRNKKDYRMFKVTSIHELLLLEEKYTFDHTNAN